MIDRPAKRFLDFEPFRIDVEERQLFRRGSVVPLTPKVFDILLALAEKPGRTISKEELMAAVWTDAYVDEGNLNRNVSTLRRALGEDAHSAHYIKTIPKRGYRFESDVREILDPAGETAIERKTKYTFAVREFSDGSGMGVPFGSLRLAIGGIALLLMILAGVWWAAVRTPTSDANAIAPGQKALSRDPEAVALYERGRALWQTRSVEALHYATQDLEQAVRRDPQFALAHAALADAYAFDVALWKKAEATANEAMRLDPGLAGPHATIGFIRTFWEWRPVEAEAYFKNAIALDPGYATAHQWYSINLIIRGNLGSSLAEIKRALELEPSSVAINGDLCQVLYISLKYDQAIEQCQRTLTIDPNYLPAHQQLYAIYTTKEMYAEAVDMYFRYEKLNATTQSKPDQLAELRHAYSSGGIRAFWRRRTEGSSASAYQLAQYHHRLGEIDEAYKWFKQAADTRSFEFLFFTSDPANYKLFREQRFKELARTLGMCSPTLDPQNLHSTCYQ